MSPERFEALVHRLEDLSRQRPRLYRLRVFLLAALGYSYILGMLGLVLATTAVDRDALIAALGAGQTVVDLVNLDREARPVVPDYHGMCG